MTHPVDASADNNIIVHCVRKLTLRHLVVDVTDPVFASTDYNIIVNELYG